MDALNRFETRTTFALVRVEFAALLCASAVALVLHVREVNWWVFTGLFAIVDLVGYIPGAIAFKRYGANTPRIYYVLYNTMHSLTPWVVLLGLWSIFVGPEWAFLAIPIHLCGDRSIFGNSMKSFAVTFEPSVHEGFARFDSTLDQGRTRNRTALVNLKMGRES